jgi:hypothetical protein
MLSSVDNIIFMETIKVVTTLGISLRKAGTLSSGISWGSAGNRKPA